MKNKINKIKSIMIFFLNNKSKKQNMKITPPPKN